MSKSDRKIKALGHNYASESYIFIIILGILEKLNLKCLYIALQMYHLHVKTVK